MFAWAIIDGIVLGSIYVLIALGLVLIYGVLEIPDFSQAGLYALGAYFTFTGTRLLGLSYLPSLVISVGMIILLGLLIERVAYRPLQKKPPESLLIVALGLLFILDNTALFIWGHEHKSISISALVGQTLSFWGRSFSLERALVIAVGAFLILGVHIFLMHTKTGDAVRAIFQDRDAAVLMGIHIGHIRAATFGASCILTAIAGSLIGSVFSVFPNMGDYIVVKGFGAIILGGMGSVVGAAVGGLIIGLAESLGATFLSSAYKDLFAFVIIILVLLFKPSGLFGMKERIG
jgi:branched-chain amino acid transport system permease protein